MPRIDRLYERLSEDPSPACDVIFAAALGVAEEPYATRIASVLRARSTDTAFAALIANYSRLPQAIQQELIRYPARLRAAIGLASRWAWVESRRNAFELLNRFPFMSLSYVIPDALRDPAPAIRDLAAGALRRMAEQFLDRSRAFGATAASPDPESRQFIDSVWTAFRKFNLHHRIEVFEIGLWFARYFGDEVWQLIDGPRSHAGYVLREHLPAWESPRMAPFLLLALKRPNWLKLAIRVLRKWSTTAEVRALLAESDLLTDPEIRAHLGSIRAPEWVRGITKIFDELTIAERLLLPRWIRCLGIPVIDKIQILARWSRTNDEHLRRAAMYAIATLPGPDAQLALSDAATNACDPLRRWSGWVLAGRATEAVAESLNPFEFATLPPAQSSNPAVEQEFSVLTQMLQPIIGRGDATSLTERIEYWRPRVRRCLQSPDPRDRIRVLRILESSGHANYFRDELESLTRDPNPGVRGFAGKLLDSAPSQRTRAAATEDAE